jgi:glucose-1-phosphatase
MDPTFNPVITDNSPEFREKALKAMETERQKMQLSESYKLLEQMTNYADSPSCKEKKSARWRTRKIPSAPTMKKSRAYPGR